MKRGGWWLVGGLMCVALLLAGCDGIGSGGRSSSPQINQVLAQAPMPTASPRPAQWRLVPNPATSATWSGLYSVAAIAQDNVWAVGSMVPTSSSGYLPLVLHYDGQQWNLMPMPSAPNGWLNAIAASSATDIWAVGQYQPAAVSQPLFLHYDGQQWALVPGPDAGAATFLSGVTATPTEAWAVGSTLAGGGTRTQPVTEHFNGTQWQIIPTAGLGSEQGSLTSVTEVAANDVWAVGSAWTTTPEKTHPLIEHYNGTRWSVVPGATGMQPGSLAAVVATSSTDVWAAGNSGETGLVEHFDGTRWSVMPTGTVSLPSSSLSAIAGTSPTNIWVAGSGPTTTTGPSASTQVIAEHWDGTRWTVMAAPNASTYENRLVGVGLAASGDAWAVGSSTFCQAGSGCVQATTVHYAS